MGEFQELRTLAEGAEKGPWSAQRNPNGWAVYGAQYGIDPETGWSDKLFTLAHDQDFTTTAAFIAAANPAVVLGLLELIEQAQGLIVRVRADRPSVHTDELFNDLGAWLDRAEGETP